MRSATSSYASRASIVLACASLGGIFVTEVYNLIVAELKVHPEGVSWLPVQPAAWRYTLLTGLTLLVFYVAALQCASTVAVVRRETNSWKWPLFQWLYLGMLAWVLAFLTRMVGRLLGAA